MAPGMSVGKPSKITGEIKAHEPKLPTIPTRLANIRESRGRPCIIYFCI